MASKPKPRKPTSDELANDPSLRWVPYRRGELLTSDELGLVRFLEYTADGAVALASYAGLAELGRAVSPLSVRRVTALYTAEQLAEPGQQPPAQAPRRSWRGC